MIRNIQSDEELNIELMMSSRNFSMTLLVGMIIISIQNFPSMFFRMS